MMGPFYANDGERILDNWLFVTLKNLMTGGPNHVLKLISMEKDI